MEFSKKKEFYRNIESLTKKLAIITLFTFLYNISLCSEKVGRLISGQQSSSAICEVIKIEKEFYIVNVIKKISGKKVDKKIRIKIFEKQKRKIGDKIFVSINPIFPFGIITKKYYIKNGIYRLFNEEPNYVCEYNISLDNLLITLFILSNGNKELMSKVHFDYTAKKAEIELNGKMIRIYPESKEGNLFLKKIGIKIKYNILKKINKDL